MGMELGDASDLNFKVGTEQVDRLYLGRAFVWPVDSIVDFAASDNLREEINFTWTDQNTPAANSYDLYEAGVRIYDDLTNGQTIAATPGTATFHIKALYDAGQGIDSNEDSGTALEAYVPPPNEAPSYISNFQASDTREEEIQFWWSNASGYPSPSYSIYKGTTLVRSGAHSGIVIDIAPSTDLYHVKAINSSGIVASNENSGTSVPGDEPITSPGTFSYNINNASCGEFVHSWDTPSGGGNMVYDLYYSTGSLFRAGVTSPLTANCTEGGSFEFYVRATNEEGYSTSNMDSDTCQTCGGGSGEEDWTTPGCFTWICPTGVTSVTLCMIGGGGSGGASKRGDETGGGHSGTIINVSYGVTPGQEYQVCVGNGGTGRIAIDGAPNWNGTAGGDSSFGGQTAGGGAGGLVYAGTNTPYPDYYGTGGSKSTCMGTFNDGLPIPFGNNAMGGEAGFAGGTNGIYDAQSSASTADATMGAGSGGATGEDIYMLGNTSSSGDGGDGYVKITW